MKSQEQKRTARTRYGGWKRNKDAAGAESDIQAKTWALNLVTGRSARTLELHCPIQEPLAIKVKLRLKLNKIQNSVP